MGVLTKAEAGTMTFYEPELEKEATYTYNGATEVLTKNDKQISSESLEIGFVRIKLNILYVFRFQYILGTLHFLQCRL